jgi:fermentation-respiration switch protein FrsA (DUF1100 family)
MSRTEAGMTGDKVNSPVIRQSFSRITCTAGILASLLLVSGCTFLFFKPGKNMIKDPEVERYAPEDVSFRSADGVNLRGWYFRARGKERGTILVCHGNVENMSTHVDAGYNLFIFDYRGYGESQGEPTVRGINLDAEAALETVLGRMREKNEGLIVFGKSLGGAVAVYTVANSPYKDRVSALILDSSFSSYRAIAREKIAASIIGWPFQYPLSYLVDDDYSPVDYIKKVALVPVLIMHDRARAPRQGPVRSRVAAEGVLGAEDPWACQVLDGRSHEKKIAGVPRRNPELMFRGFPLQLGCRSFNYKKASSGMSGRRLEYSRKDVKVELVATAI